MRYARILTNDHGTKGGIGRVVGSTATTVFVDIAHVGVVEYPRDQVEAMRFDRSIGEWGDFVPEVTS